MRQYKVGLFQRPNRPGWYGRYKTETGYVVEKFGNTKPEAEEKQAEVFLALNRGTLSQRGENLPWHILVENYLLLKDSEGLRPDTLKDISQTLQRVWDTLADSQKATTPRYSRQITQTSITVYKASRRQKVAAHSLNHDLRNIRAFVRWGIENKYMRPNIKVSMIKTDELEPLILTNKQILRLMVACDKLNYPGMKLRIQSALATSLRRSDIEKLEYAHIDRKQKTLKVLTKKTRRYNIIPISDQLINAIDHYVYQYVPKDWELIFHPIRKPVGHRLSFPKRKWDVIRNRAKQWNPETESWCVAFKSLRSTCLSLLAEQGVPVEVVQKIAGHRSITTTMKFYLSVRAERMRQATQTPLQDIVFSRQRTPQ